jgi:hypothetical protein
LLRERAREKESLLVKVYIFFKLSKKLMYLLFYITKCDVARIDPSLGLHPDHSPPVEFCWDTGCERYSEMLTFKLSSTVQYAFITQQVVRKSFVKFEIIYT